MARATGTFGLIGTALALVAAFGAMTDGNRANAAETATVAARNDQPPVFRRITAEQYKEIIADLFGSAVKLSGGFEPDRRVEGLYALGASQVSVSATGLSQYDAAARSIAEQILSKDYRAGFVPCVPADETAVDDACATQFISRTGRMLFRRPLDQRELTSLVGAAADTTRTLNDFYAGLTFSLGSMLVSPQFLFRKEVAEPDPLNPGRYRLDAYSKASRLSFLLSNSTPDELLLKAAESGEIHTPAGLRKHVDRMIDPARLETSVRAFFTDMLGFDALPTLNKDPMLYPRFSAEAAREAQEQTLLTIVDHLLTRRGDYRDLFTTRRTFLTPTLGRVYGLPIPRTTPNGDPDVWRVHTFPEGDPRVGILTHISFIALHSHPFRNSATLRGKALREVFLCQKVPDPPGDVKFTLVQETSNPLYKTARERLRAHANEPMCAGCHKIMDPMGLAFEKFDSAGGYRTTENGAAIDESGEMNGHKFKDGAEFGQVLHDMPALTSCLVNRTFGYAVGRAPSKNDADWLKSLQDGFAQSAYSFPELLRAIAMSDDFYQVSAPQ